MPRVFEPLIEKSGPLGKKKKGCIRRCRSGKKSVDLLPSIASFGEPPEEHPTKVPGKQSNRSKFIGEDLLERSGEKVELCNAKNCVVKRVSDRNRSSEVARVSTEEIARARKKYLKASRHALALDTRILDLPSTNLSITNHFQEFLRTLAVRGAPPCMLSVTIPDPHKKSRLALGTTESGSTKTIAFASGVGIQTRILSQTNDMNNIVPVVIPANKTADSIVVAVPNALTAEHSWTLLSEMVESIIIEDRNNSVSTKRLPMDITVLVTDLSLFCDTSTESHKVAVGLFLKNVVPFYGKALLNSIQIVVVRTGALVLLPENSIEHDTSGAVDASTDSVDSTRKLADQNHQLSMRTCVESMQEIFEKLEFSSGSVCPVKVSLSIMEGNIFEFKKLSRAWIRDSLAMQRLHSRVRFDMPEILDGTQCSVNLDVCYQNFPFSINSPEAKMLISDLEYISSLHFRVVQLVPISSIDASMLFGIPLKAVSGLDQGNDQVAYEQMQSLVKCLFRLLKERDLAILLHASVRSSTVDLLLNNYCGSEHMFILLPQESLLHLSPSSGLLCRIAHVDELLIESTPPAQANIGNGDVLESQYTNYIEAALGKLACSPYNPLDETMLQPFLANNQVAGNASTAKKTSDVPLNSLSPDDALDTSEASIFDEAARISSNTSYPIIDAYEADISTWADENPLCDDEPDESDSEAWTDDVGVGSLGILPLSSTPSKGRLLDDDNDNHGILAFEDD